MNDFLKKLLAGTPADIYDYSKSPEENQMAGAALSSDKVAQDAKMNNVIDLIESPRLRGQAVDFSNQPEMIQADAIPQAAKIKPSLPFAYKDKPLVLPETPAEDAAVAAQATKPTVQDLLAQLTAKKETDPNLIAAQQDRDDMLRQALWLDAGNAFGHAMAGGSKVDPDLLKNFRDLAGNKVTNVTQQRAADKDDAAETRAQRNQVINEQKALFELGDKEKENDPNSDVSKAFREHMQSYASMANLPIKINDKMSMADLQKTSGMLGNIVSAKMAADARRENMQLQRESIAASKELAGNEKRTAKNLDFAERQHDRITKSDPYKKMTTAEEQYVSAMSALKDPSGVKDIDVLYRTVRGFDPNSAVREGEIGLAQQGVSLKAVLENQMSRLGNNPRVIPKEFIEQVLKLAEVNRQVAQKQYGRHVDGIKKNARQRGLTEEDMDMIDPMMIAPVDMKTSKFPMTIRKDGKIATVSNENELADATKKGWTP